MREFVTVIIPRMVLKVPIARISEGDENLTPGEKRVFRHLVTGASNKEIANAMNCTERNVKFHVSNIFVKTGSTSRGEFVAKFGRPLNEAGVTVMKPKKESKTA